MIKILLFSICCLTSLTTVAQEPAILAIISPKTAKSNKLKSITGFEYERLATGNLMKLGQKVSYREYDTTGYLIEFRQYFPYSDEQVTIKKYRYTNKGKVLRETVYKDTIWQRTIQYTYDEDGRLMDEKLTLSQAEDAIFREYRYDSNNNRTMNLLYMGDELYRADTITPYIDESDMLDYTITRNSINESIDSIKYVHNIGDTLYKKSFYRDKELLQKIIWLDFKSYHLLKKYNYSDLLEIKSFKFDLSKNLHETKLVHSYLHMNQREVYDYNENGIPSSKINYNYVDEKGPEVQFDLEYYE